ncbi:restriction endonuclease subunit S [Janthinobacterium sp. 17J80-10]|uniref:restriction endonuclease subunit S n=1 Tax=Janthinobacterium sp. 17J80-10 TaxID=2497863 RepID=UPI0013E8F03E|nr:restriction endonuclease subunit S [Janthinobacterium sp. 17J80-10]
MSEKYRAYPEYKSTDTDWLGEAPKYWKTIPVGRLFRRVKRTNFSDKDLLSVYRDHGVVPTSSRDDNNNKPSDDLTPYQLVEPNDLVMNKMKAWQGSIAISEFEGIVSPAYFVYQPYSKLFDVAYPKYIHYLLRHPIYIAQYLRQSKGIRVSQWDLDPEEFQRIELLLPDKSEQKKIFNFLDNEIAKIDTLIEKQQQLIKLLKEKRQAVISHAVTKGLNSNAPMRDSGVEWLGEVPEHWIVAKLSFRYQVLLGKMLDDKKITGNFLAPYLRNTDVQWDSVNTVDLPQMDFRPEEQDRYSVRKGDLIVCEGGEIGRCAIWENEEPVFYQKALHRLRPSNALSDNTRFMYYQLFNAVHQERFISGAGKSTIAHLPAETFRQFKFPYPPYDEQEEISAFLDRQKVQFDLLEQKVAQQIALLQERRTALISAAVTGKIDVRNWQAPSQTTNKKIAA